MTYELVFTIGDVNCDHGYGLVLLPAFFTLLGLVAVWFLRRHHRRRKLIVAWLIVAGSALMGVGFLRSAIFQHDQCVDWKEALSKGRTQIAEGIVSDLVPEREGGRYPETFTVDGIPFQYSSADFTLAYRRPAASCAAFSEGAHVRIHHVDGAILKLEVAE